MYALRGLLVRYTFEVKKFYFGESRRKGHKTLGQIKKMKRIKNFIFTLLLCYTLAVRNSLAKRESEEDSNMVVKEIRSAATNSYLHDVIFAIRPVNLDRLHDFLVNVSNPKSATYGCHMTSNEVASLTRNHMGLIQLRKYLKDKSIILLAESTFGDFVTARASIAKWEVLFSTTFYSIRTPRNKDAKPLFAAEKYILDAELKEYISAVFNVKYFHENRLLTAAQPHSPFSEATSDGFITPEVINSYYNISSNAGSYASTQCVYSLCGQYYSSEDLAAFQSRYGIPPHQVDDGSLSLDNPNECKLNMNNCIEGNLDLQYIMAIAQNTSTCIV